MTSVFQQGHQKTTGQAWYCPEHEPEGQLLGQCRGRELLLDDQLGHPELMRSGAAWSVFD